MFALPGLPVPQGSKKLVNGRMIDVNHRELRSWRQDVAWAALDATSTDGMARIIDGPVTVTLDFYFQRPKGHFGKRGLRPSAPAAMTTRPDLDKLVRAVLDALTGVVFRDDAQVVSLTARKHYADSSPPGLVCELGGPTPLLHSPEDAPWQHPSQPTLLAT